MVSALYGYLWNISKEPTMEINAFTSVCIIASIVFGILAFTPKPFTNVDKKSTIK
jgi:hypothetical protein